jgi:hypothetical protein
LEDEPATYALGFSLAGEDDTFYAVLGLLTEEELGRRERALREVLASGKRLTGWSPPWSAGG